MLGDRNDMKQEKPSLKESANCGFGVGTDVNMCRWSNLNMSAFHWISSSGDDSYWIGGPQIDDNEKNKQGKEYCSECFFSYGYYTLVFVYTNLFYLS